MNQKTVVLSGMNNKSSLGISFDDVINAGTNIVERQTQVAVDQAEGMLEQQVDKTIKKIMTPANITKFLAFTFVSLLFINIMNIFAGKVAKKLIK